MVARGYSTSALVQDELGRTLTAPQFAMIDGLLESAEAMIDRYTGRAWLLTSPVTDELHVLIAPIIYLTNTPVATVSAVSIRSSAIGAAWTALVAGSGFELLDPAAGVLELSSYPLSDVVTRPAYSPGNLARVSYTFTSPSPVPADVRRAATLLVASWMTDRLDPASAAYESVSVAQGDIAITYKADTSTGGLPDQVAAILRSWRRVVFA